MKIRVSGKGTRRVLESALWSAASAEVATDFRDSLMVCGDAALHPRDPENADSISEAEASLGCLAALRDDIARVRAARDGELIELSCRIEELTPYFRQSAGLIEESTELLWEVEREERLVILDAHAEALRLAARFEADAMAAVVHEAERILSSVTGG